MSIFHCLSHSKQSIQVQGPVLHFITCCFLWWGVDTLSNSQSGRPPLVSHLQPLVQCIHSYPPYLKAFPPSTTGGHTMLWWQVTHLTWHFIKIQSVNLGVNKVSTKHMENSEYVATVCLLNCITYFAYTAFLQNRFLLKLKIAEKICDPNYTFRSSNQKSIRTCSGWR
jgi:hypothetical protein